MGAELQARRLEAGDFVAYPSAERSWYVARVRGVAPAMVYVDHPAADVGGKKGWQNHLGTEPLPLRTGLVHLWRAALGEPICGDCPERDTRTRFCVRAGRSLAVEPGWCCAHHPALPRTTD